MSKNVKMVIDGVSLNMVSDANKDHINKVNMYVNEVINSIKSKNTAMNTINAYRYSLVYLADQVIQYKENEDLGGLNQNAFDIEIKKMRKKNRKLVEDNEELLERLKSLQEKLTELNKKSKVE